MAREQRTCIVEANCFLFLFSFVLMQYFVLESLIFLRDETFYVWNSHFISNILQWNYLEMNKTEKRVSNWLMPFEQWLLLRFGLKTITKSTWSRVQLHIPSFLCTLRLKWTSSESVILVTMQVIELSVIVKSNNWNWCSPITRTLWQRKPDKESEWMRQTIPNREWAKRRYLKTVYMLFWCRNIIIVWVRGWVVVHWWAKTHARKLHAGQ